MIKLIHDIVLITRGYTIVREPLSVHVVRSPRVQLHGFKKDLQLEVKTTHADQP